MQGVYRLGDTISAVTTAEPLLYISVPSTALIQILRATVSCQDDVTNEQLHCMITAPTGTKAGGDARTPTLMEPTGQASACTCSGGNTAITGLTNGAASAAIAAGAVQKQSVWEYVPLPEERVWITNDEIILAIVDTITSSDLTAEIIYREIKLS